MTLFIAIDFGFSYTIPQFKVFILFLYCWLVFDAR